jgi:hypothetical protein
MFPVRTNEYEERELKAEYRFIESRSKLGVWKEEELPSVELSLARITWLLDGSYGAGAMLYAKQIIANNTTGKTGKRLENAWLSVGAQITMLVALHDTTEYTMRKISELWKKQGTDFKAVNAKAAEIIKMYIIEHPSEQ